MADPRTKVTPYRPSNGTEGMAFMERFCNRCLRDAQFQAGEGDSCPIAASTMVFSLRDPEYPPEWVTDAIQGPRCTAFEPDETGGAIHDHRQEGLAL